MPVDASMYSAFAPRVQSVPEIQNALMARQLQQAQMDQMPLHDQLLRLQVSGAQMSNAQKQQMFQLVSRITGSGGQPVNALAAPPQGAFGQPGGQPVGQPGGQPPQSPTGMPGGLSFSDIVALKAAGGPDLTNDFKLGLEGVSHAPGSEVTDVNGGRRRIAQLATGQTQNPVTGEVSNLPGAVSAAAEAAGAVKSAEERSKNYNTLVPSDRLGPDGKPISGTIGGLIDQMQPPQAPPSQQSKVAGFLQKFKAIDPNDDAALVKLYQESINAGMMTPEAANRSAANIPPAGTPERAQWFQSQVRIGEQMAGASPLSQLSPQQRIAAMADMAKRGEDPATMKVNGQPVFPASSMQRPTGSFAGFQGPAQTAADKARAEAAVKQETAPKLAYTEAVAKDAAAYKTALDSQVSTGQDLMQRINEAKSALSQFTPGMGAETRLNVARFAQSVGMPKSIVERINNGDVAAKQEFMKLSAQTAMESLKQAMQGAGRITQAEFKVFQANNPNIELDPEAIKKIYDFGTKVYQRTLAEQQAYAQHIESGGDPAAWQAKWAKQQDPTGTGAIRPTNNGWKYIGVHK